MSFTSTTLLWFLSCSNLVASQQQPSEALDAKRVQVFEHELTQLHKKLHEPGLAVGIVHGGELSWFHGLGHADIATKTPVTRDTPFHLASLTKTFASTVILDLVEQGLLELDQPVSEFGIDLEIPGFALECPNSVTTRHLLSHTAEGTPGQDYRYNGTLYSALSAIIEKLTGRPFLEIVGELIIEPLALKNTGKSSDPTRVPLASPYQLEEGKLVPGTYPRSYSTAAGMIASVADLAAYSMAIDNNKFLEPETTALAFTPTVSATGRRLPYGLGWFVEDYFGTQLIWHYGHWSCVSSLIVKIPERDLTLIALSNTDHLSRGFGMGAGSVLTSPLALSFLRVFVLPNSTEGGAAFIDGDWGKAEIADHFKAASSAERQHFMLELWSRALLAASMRDREAMGTLFEVYSDMSECRALTALSEHSVIARIDAVGSKADESRRFSLDKSAAVRVVAVGESSAGGLADYAWIEDTATQEIVWTMQLDSTQPAGGGSINRLFDGRLQLPAGSYCLRYKSDAGHDVKGWSCRPPDGLFWGVALFEDRPRSPATRTFPDETWEVIEETAELGFSKEKLRAAQEFSKRMKTAAVLVVVDGRILCEWGQVEEKFLLHSCRKSFMSALYGRYVNTGQIELDHTMSALDIDDTPPLTELERQATVRHCLQARSGVYHAAIAESAGMKSLKPARHSHNPGAHWCYNNWDFNVLHTVFRNQTGRDFFEALEQDLMGPIGANFTVADGRLRTGKESQHPAYHMVMSARDMARFGLLMLRRGNWKGTQLIPEDWVADSTRYHSDAALYDSDGYGYMWWVAKEGNAFPHLPCVDLGAGAYSARGASGHYLLVLPAHDMVIVHRVNSFVAGNTVSRAGMGRLASMIINARSEMPSTLPPRLPVQALDRYVGRYELDGVILEIVREEQRLFIQAESRPRDELLAIGRHEFHLLTYSARIVFSPGDAGTADEFVFSGLGQSHIGRRVE